MLENEILELLPEYGRAYSSHDTEEMAVVRAKVKSLIEAAGPTASTLPCMFNSVIGSDDIDRIEVLWLMLRERRTTGQAWVDKWEFPSAKERNEYTSAMLDRSKTLHICGVSADFAGSDEPRSICITGNGPMSDVNAMLVAELINHTDRLIRAARYGLRMTETCQEYGDTNDPGRHQ